MTDAWFTPVLPTPDAANTLKVGGWTRFDIGARYHTQIGRHEATFRARLDNVANKKYWASVGGYPGSGYLNRRRAAQLLPVGIRRF